MAGGRIFSTVEKVLLLQALVVLFIASVFFATGETQKSVSSMLGGLAAFIPNLYFALHISLSKGKTAKKIMRSFYAGESGKLILTAVLFFLIFQVPGLNFFPLLIGYLAVLSVFWVALLVWREY